MILRHERKQRLLLIKFMAKIFDRISTWEKTSHADNGNGFFFMHRKKIIRPGKVATCIALYIR
ncbi:hypothetical protein BJJ98_14595 [Dickeya solani]|nr:hypothetical protein BJJ98_14595 [Dickeya solani]